jgi:hypothetical protein
LSTKAEACGIYCGYCPVYRCKDERCSGCEWVNKRLRKVGGSHRSCVFRECAKEKNVKCCFLCEDFPCELDHGKDAVYTGDALDIWKELMEKELDFSE